MLLALHDGLGLEQGLNKYFKDISPIFLFRKRVYTRFKVVRRQKLVEDTLPNPMGGFVVLRNHRLLRLKHSKGVTSVRLKIE